MGLGLTMKTKKELALSFLFNKKIPLEIKYGLKKAAKTKIERAALVLEF